MQIEIRQYEQRDAAQAAEIWNEVVEDGKAFPQMEKLDEVTGHAFFTEQTYTGVAYDAATGELVGLYILHPNNVGRCGHICNASYAVKKSVRADSISVKKLVRHCIAQGENMRIPRAAVQRSRQRATRGRWRCTESWDSHSLA